LRCEAEVKTSFEALTQQVFHRKPADHLGVAPGMPDARAAVGMTARHQ
jgi:hypothetical protein